MHTVVLKYMPLDLYNWHKIRVPVVKIKFRTKISPKNRTSNSKSREKTVFGLVTNVSENERTLWRDTVLVRSNTALAGDSSRSPLLRTGEVVFLKDGLHSAPWARRQGHDEGDSDDHRQRLGDGAF